MRNHFTKKSFRNTKNYVFLLLFKILSIGNLFAYGDNVIKENGGNILLPPPTPTVTVTPPSGANCYSVITASGCGTATTQWYSKDGSVYSLYSTINPLTVIMNNAVTLRAACYDASTNQYAYSADYKVFSATTTDIIVTETPTGCPAPAVGSKTAILNASSAISGLSYQWKIYDETIPGANAASYATTASGIYKLEVNNGVCNATYELPKSYSSFSYLSTYNQFLSFVTNYAGACGNQTFTFIASPVLAGSYQWRLNGNIISGATSSSYSTTVGGSYSVDYKPAGCLTAFSSDVRNYNQILPTPTLGIVHPMIPPSTPPSVYMCIPKLQVKNWEGGGNPKIYSRPPGTSTWTPYANAVEVFVSNNNLEYKVDLISLGSCPLTTSNIIPAQPPYHATITPSSGTACAGSSVLLTANPTFPGTMMYQWKRNNNDIPGATSSTYAATQTDDYSVVTSNGPCSYTSSPVSVTIYPSSYNTTAVFSGACGSQTATLSVSAFVPMPVGTYQWKLNGTAIPGATNTTYVATTTGTYTADFTATGCSAITSLPFVFTQTTPSAPVATYNLPVFPSCFASVTSGGCDGSARPQLQRNTGLGFFNVSLLLSNISSQSAWEYRYVCVNGACVGPPSNVVRGYPNLYTEIVPASSSVCAGTLLNASSATTGLSYQWIKDGNIIAGATSSSYAVTQSGAYEVTVTKANCTYTSLVSNIVVTSAFPTITPIIGGTCAMPSVQLAANPTLGIFQWKRNGVAISGANAVTYTTTVEGVYTLDFTSGSCTATTLPYNFFINTAPVITLNPPISPSCTQILSAASCPSLVKWEQDLGAGWTVFTTTTTPIQVPNVTSSFRAKCVSGACDSPASNVIAVNAYLYTEITSIRNYICGIGPIPVLLTATSTYTGMTYQWKKNGVDIPAATSATYSASTAGDYTVAVTKNGCTYTSVLKTISLFTPQILPINATLTGTCGNQTATMVTTVFPMTLYVWKRNGVVVAGETANTLVTTIAGSYTVETAGFDADCSNQSAPFTFAQVGSPPTAVFTQAVAPNCLPSLSATGCTGITNWYKKNSSNVWVLEGNGALYNPSVNVPTEYRATCSVNTCETLPSNVVIFTPNLYAQITPNTANICPGFSVDLTAVSTFSGLTYQWVLNGTNIPGATSSTFTATQTGTYILVVNNAPAGACIFETNPMTIGVAVPLNISSLASGNWNVPATWSCNCIPTSCDYVTVETGHTVTIPVSQTGKLRNLIVKGIVDMKSSSAMKLK
jgi:hypothetical protein